MKRKKRIENVIGLFLNFAILCGIACILAGCREKKESGGWNEPCRRQLSIGESLQWQQEFAWIYIPQSENRDNEAIGYFVSGRNRGKEAGTKKQAVFGETNDSQGTGKIEVYGYTLSEEDFFTFVESTAKELETRYEEEEIVYLLNGNVFIEQLVQLDAKKEHWLFIRCQDNVYGLHGKMEEEGWLAFLNDWLFAAELRWDGLQVMKSDSSVSVEFTGYRIGIRRELQFGDVCLSIGEVLLFHADEEGFYLKCGGEYKDEPLVEEVFLRPADDYPPYGAGEEILSCLQERYPDMYSLEACFWGKDTLWDFKEESKDKIFYHVEDAEGSYGVFLWNGRPYEISSLGVPNFVNMVDTVKFATGYDTQRSFLSWKREEDGSTVMSDNLTGSHFYTKDLGNGEEIRLTARIIEKIPGELVNTITYEIEIYDAEGKECLQKMQAVSSYEYESPFRFEDFNADGYLDLTVEYFYGANGGSARHYIWNPSKREFVELSGDLNYYGMYGVDAENRRLYMHYHGSAIAGTEVTYQWTNLMDYEMIKKFEHDTTDDGVWVKISRYDNGKEEILSDYVYSAQEYSERLSEIWGTYGEEFIWEQEVTDEETGKKYMLRYTEVYLEEYARMNNGIYYDGRIYVYDEDTYLIKVGYSEIVDQAESITWGYITWYDLNENGLTINYKNGGRSAWPLSVLIRRDYQPGPE